MNSFFDVFKWDRFIAPSAMELLFWLVSAIAVLFGVWGLSSGIAMVETAPVPGLVLIAVSIIGTLAGIVAARIACEAVVILFRVNENLMDIAERGFTAMPTQIVESAAVRLEHRAPEPRQEPPPTRRQAERSDTIIEDLPPVFDIDEEDEEDAADPFAPDQGRVEPRAWDVKPVQPKAPSTEVAAPEAQQRIRDVSAQTARDRAPPAEQRARAERAVEARSSDRREPDRQESSRQESSRQEPSRQEPQRHEPEPRLPDIRPEPRAAETRAERSSPAIVVPEAIEQPAAVKREAASRRAASDEPAIEHALKRLSQPAGANGASEAAPARERRMPAARVEDADFIAPAAPEPSRRDARRSGAAEAARSESAKSEVVRAEAAKAEPARPEAVRREEARPGAQKSPAQRRRPAAEEEAVPLPAFLANRVEREAPIDLPPVLARQDAAVSDAPAEPKAPERKATAPRTVREKVAPAAAREAMPERQAEPRRDQAAAKQKPKGGQAPLKRRRPRRDRDEA
ncbi:MAG: DUF4282 domain-containing protein [Bosea sp.]|nr:DUF4282 domain-containing protein [Bosea sp. (in: a-proteobacteria)]